MRLIRRSHLVVFTFLLFLYLAVRLWGLNSTCLWFDEIFSVHAAEHDWPGLWHFVALDLIHPPLFYALLKVWIGIGGEGLLWLRLLPVLFSIIAIYPFLRLCSVLLRGLRIWPAIFGLYLIAINGSLIKYAQEVRMYSMLMCLSLFSMWLFARYLNRGEGLAALTIVNVLLVWTHHFGWFVIGAEVAALLIFQRTKWRAVLLSVAVSAVSFVPWVIAVWMAAGEGSDVGQNIGWMSRPGIATIAQLKLALVDPFYYPATSVDPASIYRISIPLLLIVSIAVVVYLSYWKQHNKDERRAVELTAIFTAVPLITAFVLSWLLPYSIWGTRHLIIVFAPASIMLALVLSRISFYKLRLAAFVLLFLFYGYAFALYATRPAPQYVWCAWEQLMKRLDPQTKTQIYATEDLIAYHLWFAARNKPNIHVTKLEAGFPEDPAYFLPRGFDEVDRTNLADLREPEIWLAFRVDNTAEGLNPVASYIEEQRYEVDSQNTRALLIRLHR